MTVLTLLRVVALTAVVAAIADPGCRRAGRRAIAVIESDPASRVAAARVRARVAGEAAAWADVLDDGRRNAADLRVVVGDAGPVAAHLVDEAAAIAVRPDGDGLTIAYITAPPSAVHGMRSDVTVAVGGVPAAGRRVTVTMAGRDGGQEEARGARLAASAGEVRVPVPWLAMGEGRRRLLVRAHVDGSGAVRDAVAHLDVEVRNAPTPVAVLEARPAWGARFARLALAPLPAVSLASEVRTAPGLTVRSGDGSLADAHVLILGGVDALTTDDVNRVERAVRDAGRVAVLLFDEPPQPGPWRRLWPDRIGGPLSAARLHAIDLGGHVWKAREWLPSTVSTEVRALAYSDTGSPVIVGRGLGAGRVVAVGALDAWRWRAEDGVDWAAGWQALVQRLAADVPAPLGVVAWVAGEGPHRVLQADVRLRPDAVLRSATPPRATVGSDAGPPRSLPLWPAGPGRYRGAVPLPAGRTATVRVAAADGSVVPATSVVVDLSAAVSAASWADVQRTQRARGADAVAEAALGPTLRQWHERTAGPLRERWYLTRQWWFAAAVLVVLGGEWILRRARRRP